MTLTASERASAHNGTTPTAPALETPTEPPAPARLGETGQWFHTPDGQRWWFDSGCLCLDFAYTGGIPEPGGGERIPNEPWELLRAATDLAAWLHDRFPAIDPACAEHELRDALTLREAIAHLALAALGGHPYAAHDVDIVNLYASTPDLPPSLAGGSMQPGRGKARATQALSAIARDAVAVFGSGCRDGIRSCGADDCGLVYLDVSRSRNRRWCSMQRCGNRAKVRAHRARRAAAPAA
ncbi:CGNR zinc finger domain-containing protein [Rathayibacter sp. KR2-224]|uniref:CGNR zinc finger domain-containing protein n=1 Tax=Rathayibacter sp. KR2-224 TaxID=3400913 RepID=UPI003C05B47E